MSKFWSSMVKRTEPYVPGEQIEQKDIVKLNTNENPYPPSPKVIAAIQQEMGRNLQLYPSPTATELRETIGLQYGLTAEEVFVGNGSDEVLAFSFMAFFEPGKPIRFPDVTYSFYPVYAKLFDIPYEEVPLNKDFTLPVDNYFQSEGGVILPNPNAPTSIYAELEHIDEIVKNNPDQVVIIDEAYIDFASKSATELIRKYDNVLVVQTTSKSRSLAGLRVGFAMGAPSLIAALIRIKDSFNSYTLDRLALVGAKAAFEDEDYFEKTTQKIIATREKMNETLQQLNFNVLPSQANFVFTSHQTVPAEFLYNELKKEGVLVRYFNKPGIDNYLRITVGTDKQVERLVEKLTDILNL
ncbi:histidinol-phosphate transaminase [Sporosarcina psychrophila]|uniref:histidinol-phosphate transaminase n=1 Tax=Sporosarcina psychrophila TaxID=1476 RepID=UPI00078E6425|nr:histidinol-phosphate transaminase [Sporosarcina psychrophila]AMQ05618.1 histidinol-phosphate transaminase [Sporosarcina psychrophila]